MKPFKASTTGTMKMSKINGPRGVASVASTFYKTIKIIDRYIKVFCFYLVVLASLYRFGEIINFKPLFPYFMQCNVATKFREVGYALT